MSGTSHCHTHEDLGKYCGVIITPSLTLLLCICSCRLPGLMALGYIAAFSETLALAVIAEKGLEPLCAAVAQESEDHIRAAAAWSLGQVGRHTPDHAKAVADTGASTCINRRTEKLSMCYEQNGIVQPTAESRIGARQCLPMPFLAMA